jgi:hypothetical protein
MSVESAELPPVLTEHALLVPLWRFAECSSSPAPKDGQPVLLPMYLALPRVSRMRNEILDSRQNPISRTTLISRVVQVRIRTSSLGER